MEWFIISRDMHVLCQPSTDAPGSLPIDDSQNGQTIELTNNIAVGSYDFRTISDHRDSAYITEGNYISFKDKYGKLRLYTIMTIDGDYEWDVHCEDAGLDLINEDAEVWDFTGSPKTIAETLQYIIADSGWTIGINEIPDKKLETVADSYTDSQLTRLGQMMVKFEVECDFEIEMKGPKVTKQVINIYEKLGEDRTKQRFIDDINLISLSKSGSIEDLCTCLRCYGATNSETNQKVTFADIEYDDGRYYSPKGHIRIYDREARNIWSRFRAYGYANQGEFDGYINGTFEYNTEDPQTLLDKGLEELKERNDKKVKYEAELYNLQADIGDTIKIADHRHMEKVYLSARVQSVTNHYSVPGKDTGVLANYKVEFSNPSSGITDEIGDEDEMVSISGSSVSYQIGDSGVTPPIDDWSSSPMEIPEGKYLWTRTIITYTNGSSTTSYSVSRNVKGDDAILLQIDSSNGDSFKNSSISTTLTVLITVGGRRIDSYEKMINEFGPEAYIMWEEKEYGETEFSVIPENDPKLSDNGFILTINPGDFYVKTVFNCNLIF